MSINAFDRHTIRELAKRQAEIAALPVMLERKKRWYGINDGKTEYPLVTMEFHGREDEVYPPLVCENPRIRDIERQLRHRIFAHEHYRDDRVIPACIHLHIPNSVTPFGWRAPTTTTRYADGSASIGYMYVHLIHDLEEDWEKIGNTEFCVDSFLSGAKASQNETEDILGDILPVKLVFPSFYFSPANILCAMMGMETMFCSIMDYPELFHRTMRRLTDDFHAYIDALEEGGAILPNNDSSLVNQDSYGYTNDLPSADEIHRSVRLTDVWGHSNFQETVGMSVPMFSEFFFCYMKEITDRCGLLSYGCCEPVHTLWEPCLSKLHNLRKLSVSPWSDEEALGEMLRGTKIVYHRKPFPNHISVSDVFDENAFYAHMAKTVKAARGCPLEVTFRDICSVRGEPQRLGRAVELTRKAFADHWQG